jgi:predicted amino acid racemase
VTCLTVIVVFSFEVVYHCILSIDKLVDICHEVSDSVCVSFMDLLEELEVSYPFL